MPPPKRMASLQAEATNKLLAAQEAAERDTLSEETSPLTSLQTETPTPPAGLGRNVGREGENSEGISERKKNLVQQLKTVQKMAQQGIRFPNLNIREDGKILGFQGGANENGSSGGSGKKGDTPNKVKTKEGMAPPKTPPSKGGNGKKNGSTQKKLKVKERMPPSSTPANGGGSRSLQKRTVSAYLEDAPDDDEEEREHERQAKRQWRVATPSPVQTPNSLASKDGDPNYVDLSHMLAAELHNQNNHPQPSLFPGLPQYPVARPGPKNFAIIPKAKPTTDSLRVHEERLKALEYQKKRQRGRFSREKDKQAHRLHTQFTKLMNDQKKDLEEKNKRPIDIEEFTRRQPLVQDIQSLAIGKLKPAKTREHPVLFGTWNHSKPIHEEDSHGCTFCIFDCDYGVADERVLLPAEASVGYCRACHEDTMEVFHELEVAGDSEMINRLGDETLEQPSIKRLDSWCIAAATPPLKELGDEIGFREKARAYVSANEKPSASPQISPGNAFGMGHMSPQQQLITTAFNGGSQATRSASAMPGSRTTREAFEALTLEQQYNFMLRSAVGGQISADAWKAFLSKLGPEKREYMIRHLSANARGQISPIMGGGAGSLKVQAGMSNRGMVGNNNQMRPSNRKSTSPILSQMSINGNGVPNAQLLSQMSITGNGAPSTKQIERAVNGPGDSPLMKPSMLNGTLMSNQGCLSNGSMPPPPPRVSSNSSGARYPQQTGQIVNGPCASPRMQSSMLSSAHISNQGLTSNSSIPPVPSQTTPNGNGAPDTQHNGCPVNGFPGTSAIPSIVINRAGSPFTKPSMLNGTDNANNPHPGRLSNSGSRPAPPQNAPNGNAIPNKEQPPPGNGVAGPSIALTRSGGIIAPTSMAGTAGVANNTEERPRPNASSPPAPAKALIAQRRNSSGQQMMLSLNGSSESPPIPNGLGIVNNPNSRPHPNGSSPRALSHDTINGGGNPDSQHMMQNVAGSSGTPRIANGARANNTNARPHPNSSSPPTLHRATINERQNPNGQHMVSGVNGSLPTPNDAPSLTNDALSPMLPPQPIQRRLSNPSSMARSGLGILLPTPSLSPSTPTLSQSTLLSPLPHPGHPHAHPNQYLRRTHTVPTLSSSEHMGPPPRPKLQRTISLTDGRETTLYQGVLFCRGSPYRQIDVGKARICDDCKAEKLAIMKHRHDRFYLLSEERGLPEKGEGKGREGTGWGGVMGGEGMRKGCMVCTEAANFGCDGCPLRLCVGCEVNITVMCKGYLDNLIYMHGDRAHIRNDAFLLRGDGGGF